MKYLLFFILALLVVGCKSETKTDTGGTVPTLNNLTVSGKVQNGPYRIFTQGSIQGLDENFNQVVGQSATAETSDVIGTYASQITFTGTTYAKVTFTGQHYVENTGGYSATDLTTSSYVFGANDSNVNLVTHIIQDDFVRRVGLGRTEAQAILEATAKFMLDATGEVVTTGANTWLISDTSPLLFISALLQHGGVEGASLQILINDMRADFANGTLPQTYIDLLKTNAAQLVEAPIHTNVATLGTTSQPFTARLNTLDPTRLITSKFVQGTGVSTGSLSSIQGVATILTPFLVTSAISQAQYISLPCFASGIKIHNSYGTDKFNAPVSGIFDETVVFNTNMFATYGDAIATATYAADTLPLRDYGNGTIGSHQAILSAPLNLPVGEYWLEMTASNCTLQGYEPVPHGFMMQFSDPNYFTFPVGSLGANTIHFELL